MRLRYALFLSALTAAPASAATAQDDAIEAKKRSLADVEQRVGDLERELGTRRGDRETLLTELEQRERYIADLARAGHQLGAMIREQEGALADLRARLARERGALHRERSALAGVLRSAYAAGRGDRIRMLLDQEDPSRLSRAMSYFGYLNRYRVGRIEAIAQRSRRLEELTREVQEEKTRLAMLARKQEETRDRLTGAQGRRAALLKILEQTIATQQESVAGLRARAQEMRALLERLERQARELPEAKLHQESLKQLRGRLDWPLKGATVRSRYGSSKGEGNQRWDGVVLAADEGAEVRAVHHGRVAYADWLRGFGLLIIIEHDDGYMTLYGHNQTLLKEPGEWVGAGDIVALSGNSGGRASAGLYFAIRHRGRPLNPEQWCRREKDLGRLPFSPMPATVERGGIFSLQTVGNSRASGARVTVRTVNIRSMLQ